MKPSPRSHRPSAKAYTLIEIVLVLAILSVLMGLGIKYLTGTLGFAKEKRVEGDLQTITTALKQYEMMNLMLPTTEQGLKALVSKPSTDPAPQRWRQCLEKELTDPWNHPYGYRNPGKKNPDKFDVFSLGPDGSEGTDDDLGNWEPGK